MHFAILLALLALTCADRVYKPQPLARNQDPPQHPLTFSVTNCGATTGVKILAASVLPDPIILGQNVTISASAMLAITFDNTEKGASLTIDKKELGVWVEIPCLDGVGSCDYNGADLCTMLANLHPDVRDILNRYGIPNMCPIKPGTYGVPVNNPINAHIKDPGLSWLTSGDLYVKVEIADTKGTQVGCLEVYFSLASAEEQAFIDDEDF